VHLAITGGSGFVGRHVVAGALARGDSVTVLSRDPGASDAALAAAGLGARSVPADLGDESILRTALAGPAPDAVIHAAALLEGSPEQLQAVNVAGTAALIGALRSLPAPPRLVLISSFAVEDTPPTPYSDSKLAAESLVRESGLPWVILRPALVYGPGDRNNTERLVARLRAGAMWLPAGGRVQIQPVHVHDVAAACLAAVWRDEALGGTYRLGGAEPISVRAWREAVRDATGGRARIRAIPLPLFALAARGLALLGKRSALGVLTFHRNEHRVDSTAALADLDYRPRPLERGLRETFGSA
jgi:nucleoside-diphosphate-sugar epimerase